MSSLRARWYSIEHLPRLGRSYRRVIACRKWALVLIRTAPPNVDQSRKAGQ